MINKFSISRRQIVTLVLVGCTFTFAAFAISLWQTGVSASDSRPGDRVFEGQPRTRLRYAPVQPTGVIAEIMDLIERGKIADAEVRVNGLLADNPSDMQALFFQGVILTEQGKIESAIEVFETLTRSYPALPEPYNNLAVLYAANNQYDKARDALIKALNTDTAYATAYKNLTDVYAIMAGMAYDKALELWDENEIPETSLAMIIQPPPISGDGVEPADTGPAVVAAVEETDRSSDTPETPVMPQSIPDIVVEQPPARVPTPATDPPPKPEEAVTPPPVTTVEQSVPDAVTAWAQAWSRQDVDAYLASYATDFQPPSGESHQSWAQNRRIRIQAPDFIEVSVENLSVEKRDAVTAQARFLQSYRSNTFRAKVRKTLVFKLVNDQWKILQELVGQ